MARPKGVPKMPKAKAKCMKCQRQVQVHKLIYNGYKQYFCKFCHDKVYGNK